MKKVLLALLVSLGLQTQAQQSQPAYFCCDSINYWTDQGQAFYIGLDTSNIVHNPDSIEVWWAVCTNGLCYSGQGMTDSFFQIMTTDTLKVCYDAYIYEANSVEVCTTCDSLIFDQNTYSWIMFSMSQPTSINELTFNRINDGKIYDILGKEVFDFRNGVMYIRNNKKFIIVE